VAGSCSAVRGDVAALGSSLGAIGSVGGPVGAAIGAVAGGLLGSILSPGVDPRIAQYIKPAIAAGNVGFLEQWIADQPPHPRDSVIAAQQGLAQLLGRPSSGGRLAAQPAPFTPAGTIPVTYQGRTIGIPFTL
jgi:hypothetical protein